jgi:hypothetical protein
VVFSKDLRVSWLNRKEVPLHDRFVMPSLKRLIEGDPDYVRQETLRILDFMAPGGG